MTDPTERSPGQVVTAFIRAIEAGDWDTVVALADPEIVFENVPQEMPYRITSGPEAVRNRLAPLQALSTEVTWRVLTQVEQGDTVMNERVDTFHFPPGTFPKSDVFECPVATVWRIRAGRVLLWRDYYDLAEPEKQLGVSLAEFGAVIGRAYTSASAPAT